MSRTKSQNDLKSGKSKASINNQGMLNFTEEDGFHGLCFFDFLEMLYITA